MKLQEVLIRFWNIALISKMEKVCSGFCLLLISVDSKTTTTQKIKYQILCTFHSIFFRKFFIMYIYIKKKSVKYIKSYKFEVHLSVILYGPEQLLVSQVVKKKKKSARKFIKITVLHVISFINSPVPNH